MINFSYGVYNMAGFVGQPHPAYMGGMYGAPMMGATMYGYPTNHGAIWNVAQGAGFYDMNYGSGRGAGFWGNNPGMYFMNAMGAHARSIAVPGGMYAQQGAPAQQQAKDAQQAQEAQGGQASGKTTASDEDKDAEEAKAAKKAEEAEKKQQTKALAKAKESVSAQAKTALKSKDHIVGAIEKSCDDAKTAETYQSKYEKILTAVPNRVVEKQDPQGRKSKVRDENWRLEFGKFWAQHINGLDVDKAAKIAEEVGYTRVSTKGSLDYMRVNKTGTEKDSKGVVYDVFEVTSGSAVGKVAKEYEGKKLYYKAPDWYTKSGTSFRKVSNRNWLHDHGTGELSLRGKNWSLDPKNESALDNAVTLSEAIDRASGVEKKSSAVPVNGTSPAAPANGSTGTTPIAVVKSSGPKSYTIDTRELDKDEQDKQVSYATLQQRVDDYLDAAKFKNYRDTNNPESLKLVLRFAKGCAPSAEDIKKVREGLEKKHSGLKIEIDTKIVDAQVAVYTDTEQKEVKDIFFAATWDGKSSQRRAADAEATTLTDRCKVELMIPANARTEKKLNARGYKHWLPLSVDEAKHYAKAKLMAHAEKMKADFALGRNKAEYRAWYKVAKDYLDGAADFDPANIKPAPRSVPRTAGPRPDTSELNGRDGSTPSAPRPGAPIPPARRAPPPTPSRRGASTGRDADA